jgi:hypothetical protein
VSPQKLTREAISAVLVPEFVFVAGGDDPYRAPVEDGLNDDRYDGGPAERDLRRKYTTAVHEAGHAVAQYRLGYEFYSVTIIPNEESDGAMWRIPPPDKWDSDDLEFAPADGDDDFDDDVHFESDGFFTADERKRLWRYYRTKNRANPLNGMVVSLAGPVAEAIHSGRPLDEILKDGGAGDLDHIKESLSDQGVRSKADIQQAMVKLERDTSELVRRHWTDICRIADALMVCRHLSFDKFVAYLDSPTADLPHGTVHRKPASAEETTKTPQETWSAMLPPEREAPAKFEIDFVA